jgi:hypothetical protein
LFLAVTMPGRVPLAGCDILADTRAFATYRLTLRARLA